MNVNKLKGKIIEKGLNVESLGELIGIDRSSMYRKLSSGRFTIAEAKKIKNVLDLTNEEACDIFFAQEVA